MGVYFTHRQAAEGFPPAVLFWGRAKGRSEMKHLFFGLLCLALLLPQGFGGAGAVDAGYKNAYELPPLSSALHVLPPLGGDDEEITQADRTLEDHLLVTICEVNEDKCIADREFASQKVKICRVNGVDCITPHELASQGASRGPDYLQRQNKLYQVNWPVSRSDAGQTHAIRFSVAGLEIGKVTYTPTSGQAVPIRFYIDDHPSIRARVRHEQGYSAPAVAGFLVREFDLDEVETARTLLDEKFAPSDLGAAMRDFFELGPQEAAQVLKDGGASISVIWDVLEKGYHAMHQEVGPVFRSLGFSLPEVYEALKARILGTSSPLIIRRDSLVQLGYSLAETVDVMSYDIAAQFAPQLRFDGSANTFPMDAQVWWDVMLCGKTGGPTSAPNYESCRDHSYPNRWGNTSISSILNGNSMFSSLEKYKYQIPTYFRIANCGYPHAPQLRIEYWWFYGKQQDADAGCGQDHPADWEHVMVTTSLGWDDIAAVTYYQHSGHYTRIHGKSNTNFGRAVWSTEGYTHPVVYVGKTAHGSYHDSGGSGTCLYYEDWRNPSANTIWNTWETPLINLKGDEQQWLEYDRKASWYWGYDGTDTSVGTHPTTATSDLCYVRACDGKGEDWKTYGCSPFGKSDCKAGDCWCGTFYCSHDCSSCVSWEWYKNDYWLPLTDQDLIW